MDESLKIKHSTICNECTKSSFEVQSKFPSNTRRYKNMKNDENNMLSEEKLTEKAREI